ncbi:flagellar hook-associated protein 1 FlgK [Tibeticola sediminis]|uniref:Flagellar hook-associated protein 1 n=1 Tax=Tibeticola sediminis TaxID=1917811 RepID=A0A3N4USQ6_9BURK|nr:flagellar hook-associated protein FlgK [Tibeticola sediminis]RPE70551.1 flagellar hook-associated protein 1 FlgK [Tibeticola sediminis]
MGGISGLVGNALTGLQAAQKALQVTGNNIANVNTPGYSRETLLQTPQAPSQLGGLYLGNGVLAETVSRSYDAFVQGQIWSSTASASGARTFNDLLQPLVGLIANDVAGLGSSLNRFFSSGVAQVAAYPADTAARQTMLGQAQTLAQTVQTTASQLYEMNDALNLRLRQGVEQVNELTRQIAQLNVQINDLSGSGQSPNTLLDQRDQLITELAGQVGISVVRQRAALNIYTSNGQVLVAGERALALEAKPGSFDPSALEIGYVGNPNSLSSSLQGGALGALIQFREQSLQPAQRSLGLIATGLASAVNAQQAQGLDLNGQFGGPLFEVGPVQVLGASGNSSGVSISGSVTDASRLRATAYELSYDGAAWNAIDRSTQQAVALTVSNLGPVTQLDFDGVRVSVQGAQAGDRFQVEPTAAAAYGMRALLTDPRKIAAAAPYVSSAGALSSGALVNTNLGNLTLSAGAATATSGSVLVSATAPQALQITLTSGGTSGQSIGFTVTQPGTTAPILATGSLTLGSSGTTISVPYPSPGPGGYWTVTLSGNTAVSGDAFTLSPPGPGNGGNARAMAALQTAKLLDAGPTTPARTSLESAYAQLVGRVASQGNLAQNTANAAEAVARQNEASRQAIAGVNLDEEAARLIQFQQAYQAAAKAIQVGNTLFASLLQAVQ